MTGLTLLKTGGDILGQRTVTERGISLSHYANIEKSLEVEQREVDGAYQLALLFFVR